MSSRVQKPNQLQELEKEVARKKLEREKEMEEELDYITFP